MRIALFSDIHGNITGTRAVLADIAEKGGADVLYAAGDLLNGGPGARDLLDLLRERGVRLLRGNAEEIILQPDARLERIPERLRPIVGASAAWVRGHLTPADLDLLAGLPLAETIEVAAGRTLLICHAAPADPWARVCSPLAPLAELRAAYGGLDADVVAYGHWHAHHVLPLDGKLLLNVASVGFRVDPSGGDPGGTLAAWTLVEYADERWIVRQFLTPYDAAEEDRLALVRGMPR